MAATVSVGPLPAMARRPRVDRVCRSRAETAAALAFVALFAGYALVTVRRHQVLLTSGYDLGIFEQSVRAWSHGQGPTSRLKGVDYPLLGDHFSPIVALLGPLYRIFPTPVTLLVAQAALFAVGVVPLFRFCGSRIGAPAAWVSAAAYGLSVGVTRAVTFDFHEVAFAVPLLSFALIALVESRFRAALGWSLPLLLVKEDLGLTAAAIALLVAWRWPAGRRIAVAVAGVATAWTTLAVLVVIPAVNPGHANAYTGHVTLAGIADPGSLRNKLATVAVLLAAGGFGALRSPILLVAAPTLGWRFLNDNPAYWGTGYHYGAVLVPVVLVAAAEAMAQGRFRPGLRRCVLGLAFAVDIVSGMTSELRDAARPSFWSTPAEVTRTLALLRGIPDGASVSASNWLAPQLTARAEVALFGTQADPGTDFVVVDRGNARFPISAEGTERLLQRLAETDYRVVDTAGSTWLLQRREPS